MKGGFTPAHVRERILSAVSENGGHLASSLGAVELACALTDVFDPDVDRVVWDVGHQAYAWKILTGRADRFGSLRRKGGLAPFLEPSESAADAFVSGHAGVALAAAIGLAMGAALTKSPAQTVAVVGEASLANGESLEALRNLAAMPCKVTLVVNDNGSDAIRGGYRVDADFFRAFDLPYLGPVDGHDVHALAKVLSAAKEGATSMVVHVITKKGKGFPPAEANPSAWHCVSPFDLSPSTSIHLDEGRSETWSDRFGVALAEAARRDGRVCAVVAAMRNGTGLSAFAEEFPDRFFDVGICEEMAVTFAAGLAKSGLRPVVAIYSTFLQRAVDQIQHDVCLQRLPVVFAVDRAGCVGADGATHHGLYDIPLLRPLTGMRIVAPTCADELSLLLSEALAAKGPTAIRYPKGVAPLTGDDGEGHVMSSAAETGERPSVTLCAVGDQVAKARKVQMLLGRNGIAAEVVPVCRVKPFVVQQRPGDGILATLENGVVSGGFGESVGADLRFGWPDAIVGCGTVEELEREFGFDAEAVAATILRRIGR